MPFFAAVIPDQISGMTQGEKRTGRMTCTMTACVEKTEGHPPMGRLRLAVKRLIDGARETARQHRTRRDLARLPSHLRRDIGVEELPEDIHRREIEALRLWFDR